MKLHLPYRTIGKLHVSYSLRKRVSSRMPRPAAKVSASVISPTIWKNTRTAV